MLRRPVAVAALVTLLGLAAPAAAHRDADGDAGTFDAPPSAALYAEPIAWQASTSYGIHSRGRLAGGVRLPRAGLHFFTWDPVLKRAPNRPWRRFGHAEVVRTTLAVLSDFAAANPLAPRVGVGDLSRPGGGDFGRHYGGLGHVSHQNGLDVDVYFPRRDRLERPPRRPSEIDRPLAQELVDRFVAAGAIKVFVGPRTGLTGPPDVVQTLPHHDNHLHARFAAPGPTVARPP